MNDSASLLNAGCRDVELQHGARTPFQSRNEPAFLAAPKSRRKILFQMVIFNICSLIFMSIHLIFFTWQNGKPVSKTIPQNLSTALANILAILAEISLLGGLGVAYEHILLTFWQKRPIFGLGEVLRTLNSNPWNLVRPKVLVWIIKVRELWLVSLLCAGVPFAILFPPGALTVGFENAVSTTLRDVPTMNISDFGNGTYASFRENCFLGLAVHSLKPNLMVLAREVLSSGRITRLPSPCGSSCEYPMDIEGPRFKCRKVGPEKSIIGNCRRANNTIYRAQNQKAVGAYDLSNNSFKIGWRSAINGKCNNTDVNTLDCFATLATYNLYINNSRDGSQSITADIDNERKLRGDTGWMQDIDGKVLVDNSLSVNFTNAQAYGITRGAIYALQGLVYKLNRGSKYRLEGPAFETLYSPYIGFDYMHENHLNITAEKIERYLEDLTISTISLGMSTHNGDITAKQGTEVYQFNEKIQFFVGYGVCLAVSLCICLFSFFSLPRSKTRSIPRLTRARPLHVM